MSAFRFTLEFANLQDLLAFLAVVRGAPLDEALLTQLTQTLTTSTDALARAVGDDVR